MKLIRRGTFETNSSSTHSITMCSESDFNRWKNGELYFSEGTEKFYDEQGRIQRIKELIIHQRAQYHNGCYTYNNMTVEYEDLDKLYTKENLDKITDDEIQKYLDEDFDYYEIPITYEEWDEYFEYEKYEETYETDKGEQIVAFGYYGYDG